MTSVSATSRIVSWQVNKFNTNALALEGDDLCKKIQIELARLLAIRATYNEAIAADAEHGAAGTELFASANAEAIKDLNDHIWYLEKLLRDCRGGTPLPPFIPIYVPKKLIVPSKVDGDSRLRVKAQPLPQLQPNVTAVPNPNLAPSMSALPQGMSVPSMSWGDMMETMRFQGAQVTPVQLEIARQQVAANEASKQAFAEGYLGILGMLAMIALGGRMRGGGMEAEPNLGPGLQPAPGNSILPANGAYPDIDGIKFRFHTDDKGAGYVDFKDLGRGIRAGTMDLYRRDGGSGKVDVTRAVDVFKLAERQIVLVFDEETFKRSTYYANDGKAYTVMYVPLDHKGFVQAETPQEKPAAALGILDEIK